MLEKKDLEMIGALIQPLHGEIREARTDLKGEIQEVRTDLEGKIEDTKTTLRGEIQEVRTDLEGKIEEAKTSLGDEIKDVKLTLENETDRSIQVVVEGHMDLSRKLNEVLKLKEDDEMVRMRLNRLEREMETVKKKIG